MEPTELSNLTITHAAGLIRSGAISPSELTQAFLTRIERLNSKLNTFLAVMADEALREARHATEALTRRENWGPLHGIPIAIKDLIDIAGERTTAGSLFLKDNIAADDAEVVRLLRAAGAILIGKTHLHEFAIGATNVNPHYGPARNPWNLEYSPGGSSGGSAAAVAASMCLGALGTDTGGSIRMPSALCGLTGLRPGKGRISTTGVVPMSWTLDTVGPMAHSAQDVAILMDALDSQPASHAQCLARLNDSVKGLRIGLPVDDLFWLDTDHQIVAAVRTGVQALVDHGCEVIEIELSQVKAALRAASVISLADAAAYHMDRLETQPDLFGEDVRARLEWGLKRTGAEYALAVQTGQAWQNSLQMLFREQIDVLALPTTPHSVQPIAGTEALTAAREMLRFTYPFSLSNLPSLSMPCSFTEDGFPIGMQLVAPAEALLTQVAHAYQQITGWHMRRPDLPI
jgi:aspartyl-tRNA(Asn)/glutamyl-tRNA(Gln) amidotransferase subunit A